VAGDETWVHKCVPENKRQPKEYCHEGHKHQKNSKPKNLLKVMLIVFWISEGVALTATVSI
jgi:hypothetical protein